MWQFDQCHICYDHCICQGYNIVFLHLCKIDDTIVYIILYYLCIIQWWCILNVFSFFHLYILLYSQQILKYIVFKIKSIINWCCFNNCFSNGGNDKVLFLKENNLQSLCWLHLEKMSYNDYFEGPLCLINIVIYINKHYSFVKLSDSNFILNRLQYYWPNILNHSISMMVVMVTKLEFLLVVMENNLDFQMNNPNMHGFHIVLILST